MRTTVCNFQLAKTFVRKEKTATDKIESQNNFLFGSYNTPVSKKTTKHKLEFFVVFFFKCWHRKFCGIPNPRLPCEKQTHCFFLFICKINAMAEIVAKTQLFFNPSKHVPPPPLKKFKVILLLPLENFKVILLLPLENFKGGGNMFRRVTLFWFLFQNFDNKNSEDFVWNKESKAKIQHTPVTANIHIEWWVMVGVSMIYLGGGGGEDNCSKVPSPNLVPFFIRILPKACFFFLFKKKRATLWGQYE